MSGSWDLEAKLSELYAAQGAWERMARFSSRAADDFARHANNALGEWEGDTADAFATRRSELVKDLDKATEIAGRCAAVISYAASDISRAQGALDSSWQRVSSVSHTGGPSSAPTFQPEDADEEQLVQQEMAEAERIRQELDEKLSGYGADVDALSRSWGEITRRWNRIAGGAPFIWNMPQEGSDVGILQNGDEVVLSAGKEDNRITVMIDPKTGDQIVKVEDLVYNDKGEIVDVRNTQSYRIPAGKHLTIRGGGGDDIIALPSDATVGYTVVGGDGLDRITGGGGDDRLFGSAGDDEIKAGAGNDYASGGAGHDYLDGQTGNDRLFGGRGRDTAYGLGGTDKLSGGQDADYLEGGEGKDELLGGDGDDVVSGGRGNDHMLGGSGNDTQYGGLGADTVMGGQGDDTLYDDKGGKTDSVEKDITVQIEDQTSWIKIEGSPEFIARTQADLDMLSASPAGAELLGHIKENHENSGLFGVLGKNSLTIKELIPPENNPGFRNSYAYPGHLGHHSVEYLPTIDDFGGAPPVVVLQHELAHVDTFGSGIYDSQDIYDGDDARDNMKDNPDPDTKPVYTAERQAVGLPIDHDDNPNTPEIVDPRQPIERTENGLRKEMGWPERESYR
ncbi:MULTISPECIES: M91 family zinc metallopeptidase [unclassified Actinobaculum]|uniref:M91 family zinc metallopeptidase n=1 Tax=unclassified Actinobaculum TaxID=2609299 RepID=UPI000D526592|nr:MULTISPECIES: M91 family zinc metallopeptidase [unclassified Actinobaculum]AWE41753.1 hypothetical protein DDD63_02125 [Actinobaculum sp. 313]RTE50331.1 hypothetical protein EKN07_03785 [Actinobaculum sp. 352]